MIAECLALGFGLAAAGGLGFIAGQWGAAYGLALWFTPEADPPTLRSNEVARVAERMRSDAE